MNRDRLALGAVKMERSYFLLRGISDRAFQTVQHRILNDDSSTNF